MPQSVDADALVERLWQAVIESLAGRDVVSLERIGQAHRVARNDSRQRRRGQPVGRPAAGRLGMKRAKVRSERASPHQPV